LKLLRDDTRTQAMTMEHPLAKHDVNKQSRKFLHLFLSMSMESWENPQNLHATIPNTLQSCENIEAVFWERRFLELIESVCLEQLKTLEV
jgi:hypothetical protein